MSRHIIAHATKKDYFFIVGYDRPAGAFFCQSWRPDANHPRFIDNCFDIADLTVIGAAVPPELRDILIKEALGESDTQAIMDWRLPTDQRDLRAAALRKQNAQT